MNFQDDVFRLAFAMLTKVVVTPQHILPYVPEARLLSLLILLSCDIWVLQLLHIKLRCLYSDAANRQNRTHQSHQLEMKLNPVLN